MTPKEKNFKTDLLLRQNDHSWDYLHIESDSFNAVREGQVSYKEVKRKLDALEESGAIDFKLFERGNFFGEYKNFCNQLSLIPEIRYHIKPTST